jgi:hypothetical protein
VPPELYGQITLVVTSPPYGLSTHGHVRTPDPGAARSASALVACHLTADDGSAPRLTDARTSD